jgi:hypothetical protein
MVHLDPSKGDSEKTTGWLCTHPTYNLRIINGFIYGERHFYGFTSIEAAVCRRIGSHI